jgi:hypothetical protein
VKFVLKLIHLLEKFNKLLRDFVPPNFQGIEHPQGRIRRTGNCFRLSGLPPRD